MWDQRCHTPPSYVCLRIIPTYVGSTAEIAKEIYNGTNHSHVCGINCLLHLQEHAMLESFPRMWDQPSLENVTSEPVRIIPTYVGSTRTCKVETVRISNHSHVCGINLVRCENVLCLVESFPRMWDQLSSFLYTSVLQRIIPTYVGSTLQIAFTLHQAIQHLVVLRYWRMVYDFLDPQYVLALNSS